MLKESCCVSSVINWPKGERRLCTQGTAWVAACDSLRSYSAQSRATHMRGEANGQLLKARIALPYSTVVHPALHNSWQSSLKSISSRIVGGFLVTLSNIS